MSLNAAAFEALSKEEIRAALHPIDQAPPPDPNLRSAAVLCPLQGAADAWRVLLTRRGDTLPTHAGQVAFPGGKIEPTDSGPLGAALRESAEEIGLAQGDVEILGALDAYQTLGFSVIPFVGVLAPKFRAAPCEREVAEVFDAPFGLLMDRRNHMLTMRGGRGRSYMIPYLNYDIWGATAGMLRNLSDRLIAARLGAESA